MKSIGQISARYLILNEPSREVKAGSRPSGRPQTRRLPLTTRCLSIETRTTYEFLEQHFRTGYLKTKSLLTCVDEPDDLRGYRLKRWVQRCCRSKRISYWETLQPIEQPRDNLLQRQSFQPFGGADCAFHTIEWLWCLSVEARSKSRHQEIWWCRTLFLFRSSHIILQVHWW